MVAGIIVVLAIFTVGSYNGLVARSSNVDNAWAQVESQYQRRYDLVPNLVEATKGTLKQEQVVFDNIAQARSSYAGATKVEEKAASSAQLESALGRLLVIVENYPQLKSNETVLSLMDELAGTENRISVERQRYNDLVKDYNVSIRTFPTVLVANTMGFTPREYFNASLSAQNPVQVDLTIEK